MLMRMRTLQRTCYRSIDSRAQRRYRLRWGATASFAAMFRFQTDRSYSCRSNIKERPQQRAFSPSTHLRLLSHMIVVLLVVDAFALVVLGRLYIVLLIRADMSIRTRFSFLAVDVGLATLETTDLAIGQLT